MKPWVERLLSYGLLVAVAVFAFQQVGEERALTRQALDKVEERDARIVELERDRAADAAAADAKLTELLANQQALLAYSADLAGRLAFTGVPVPPPPVLTSGADPPQETPPSSSAPAPPVESPDCDATVAGHCVDVPLI